MSRRTLAVVILCFVFQTGSHPILAESTEVLPGVWYESGYSGVSLFQAGADRDACQQDCRERSGVFFGFPRGDAARSYGRCIEDCNRKFWKDYDRNTRELEKEKP
ncbi:MAG TPA: hypothetical protein VK463_03435 [Desulfomonilaceae bacterium]|nr:hypothetical protein [Desulfomonilaceae bacterium]